MQLEFEDIVCRKPPSSDRLNLRKLGRRNSDEPILKGISGSAPPGEMVAVMGSSGCGKTTLLDVLSGARTERVTGSVSFNGNRSRKMVGYIRQGDCFVSDLTVYEILKYEALVKLGRKMNFKRKMTWVQDVIEETGLQRCRNTVVQSTVGKGGVSGGEMKRLSVACILMMKRPVLLLDEPTSGMDSHSALEFVSCLEALTRSRKLVVMCVIHQPSAQVLAKFPRLIWLEAGEVVYQGCTNDLEQYLTTLGLTCPSHLSMVEFMSQLARNPDTCLRLKDASKSHITRLPSCLYEVQHSPTSDELTINNFATSPASPAADADNRLDKPTSAPGADADCIAPPNALAVDSEVKQSAAKQRGSVESDVQTRSSSVAALSSEGVERSDSDRQQRRRSSVLYSTDHDLDWSAPRYWTQVYWLFRRTLRSTLSHSLDVTSLCQMLIPGLFLGLVMFQNLRDPTEDDIARVVLGLIFFGVFSAIKSSYLAMNMLYHDVDLFYKERSTSAYPLSAFLLAHSLARMVRHTLSISGFFLTAAPLAGIRMSPSIFLSTWALLLLVASVGDAGALMVWSCVNTEADARNCILLVGQASALLGGNFAPQTDIPLWIRWLPSLLPWTYVGNVVAQNVLLGMNFRCSQSNSGPCPISSQAIIDRFFYLGLSREQNVCVLIGFEVAFYALSYVVLRVSGKRCSSTSKCRSRSIETI
eukprot:GHVS01068066.1.p1 GENE.GHVS01068066.1~~GHVS01068066.1.p1  ORF type:complete len:699 (+),score=33.70 GHVS01068066.1:155-2251(+)